MESKTGENMFCMWNEKIFLRVRARFVECRDALMQIWVSLDWDKNSSVGVAGALVASEKRLTVRLRFAAKITNRACEWEETYVQTLFCQKDYQSSLWVRRDLWLDFVYFVCHEGYQSGLRVRGELRSDLFYLFFTILMTNWTCQWKRQTDSIVERRKRAFKKEKKIFFPTCKWFLIWFFTTPHFFIKPKHWNGTKRFCSLNIHHWNKRKNSIFGRSLYIFLL